MHFDNDLLLVKQNWVKKRMSFLSYFFCLTVPDSDFILFQTRFHKFDNTCDVVVPMQSHTEYTLEIWQYNPYIAWNTLYCM